MGIFANLPSILLILIGFGILIFVHELGHFLAAKWAGIRTEAFAVGMGPVAISWRKGIGVRLGSTKSDYRRRVREHLAADESRRKPGESPDEALRRMSEGEFNQLGDSIGLGETEYSLRWLPIGGFVKMLGQEDANPTATSDDPRSYNMRPVGKRMIVVSAGVIMNVILAFFLFIWAFLVGVKFEAPVVGDVSESMPAGMTLPTNAEALGITGSGLMPGDEIIAIDGDAIETFADVQVASAMAKPDEVITLTVHRAGYEQPLEFELTPQVDELSGLLSLGIARGSSNTLLSNDAPEIGLVDLLESTGLAEQGIEPGMRLVSAGGEPVRTFEQFQDIVAAHGGASIETTWTAVDQKTGDAIDRSINAEVPINPQYQVLPYAELAPDGVRENENGLFGLVPLTRIAAVQRGSANRDLLREGDVLMRVGSLLGPRLMELKREIAGRPGESIRMTVLRDGELVDVTAQISRQGRVGIALNYAFDLPMIAQPMSRIAKRAEAGQSPEITPTPVAGLNLMPRTSLDAVNGEPVDDWASLRRLLREATADAAAGGEGATVELTVTHPTPGRETATLPLELTAADVETLHELSWSSALPLYAFEPIYTTLSAGGNPLKAVAMGVERTHSIIMLTYVTIDRLFRGTVGVEQLRGPVGIVHLGVQIIDKGFMYFVFLMGMISVNLAVINFLPLPIVDGGLFLYLVYEKIKGKPPSLQFQNVATIVGLCLIGTIFLVTFYNDIARLIG